MKMTRLRNQYLKVRAEIENLEITVENIDYSMILANELNEIRQKILNQIGKE